MHLKSDLLGGIPYLILLLQIPPEVISLELDSFVLFERTSVKVNGCCGNGMVLEGDGCIKSKELEIEPELSSLRIPQYLTSPVSVNYSSIKDLQFSIGVNLPICSNGSFEVTLNLKQENSQSFFTPNGYFKYDIDYYSSAEYCVKRSNEDSLILRVCHPECHNPLRPCVRRCCEFGEVWDLSGERIKCRASGEKIWEPALYEDAYTQVTPEERSEISIHYKSVHPREWCIPDLHNILIISNKPSKKYSHQPFRVLKNGKLLEKVSRRRWSEVVEEYACVDGGQGFPGENESELYSGDSARDSIFFFCTDQEDEIQNEPDWVPMLYSIAQIVSCFFLLLTAVIYLLLWDKQNIHGWTLLGHILCLFLFYLSLATTQIYSATEGAVRGIEGEVIGGFCLFLAISSHFFWLSAFFWMTLINFDLWWTFSSLMPTGGSKGRRRFTLYCLFATICPIVIVAIGLILESLYGDDPESEIIVPGYARTKCFMDTEYAVLPYIYGPIAFLLGCNLVFFGSTVWGMHKIQKSTKFAVTSSSKSKKQKQRRLLFAKLFLIMGVTWVFELIGWAIHGEHLTWYQIILDFANILQAIAIFIIFVCKSEILGNLTQKYPLLDRFMDLFLIKPERAEELNLRYPMLKCLIDVFTKAKPRADATTSAYTNKTTYRRRGTVSNTITEEIELS